MALQAPPPRGTDAVLRALNLGTGFQLLVILSPSARESRALADALQSRPGGLHHLAPRAQEGALTFERDGVTLWAQVMELWPDRPTLLDTLLATHAEAFWRPMFSALNEQRNQLYDRFPHGLLIAIPQPMLAWLAQEAPDLWSVRTGVFELEAATETTPDLLEPALQIDLSARQETPSQLSWARQDLELARQAMAQQPEALEPRRAYALALVRVSEALASQGSSEWEEALAVTREATGILQPLAEAHPEVFKPDLAKSLNNLASLLSRLGYLEVALKTARGVVEIRRELAQAHPDACQPDLAQSLHNLANHLSKGGLRKDALAAAREAVDLYRELAQRRPDTFRSGLAMSLNIQAKLLSELGQSDAALEVAREAVDIYRKLAKAIPNAFQHYLAMSLNNLANCLSELGQREGALEAARETVNIRRDLTKAHPDRFQSELAGSLNNLASFLGDMGQPEEALGAAKEAVSLYRDLAQTHRDALRPNLASSLNTLANRLSNLGQRQKALEAVEEALELYHELATDHPDIFRPNMAKACLTLGRIHREAENWASASSAFTEGLRALTPPFRQLPQAFLSLMNALAADYREAMTQQGLEPDLALLEPLVTWQRNHGAQAQTL